VISAQIVAELIAAGIEGDALVAALRRIEEASRVTSHVTAGALRTRRWRENKTSQNVTVTSQSVTSDDPTNISLKKEEESKKEIDVGSRHKASPRRIKYPPRFQAFWESYPTDDGMSKAEALPEWQKLGSDEQEACIASMPAFKAWIAKQGPDYRTIHAVRYLKKRRWEGFSAATARLAVAMEAASSRVYIKYGTEAGDAWEAHYRLKGKVPPRDQSGGWWFDTEYPSHYVSQQTSSDQAA
jgi:hypothetical protein